MGEHAAGAIYAAMANIQADVEPIAKDQTNTGQGFKFRGIDDVYNALHGLFAKYRVFCLPQVLSERSEDRESARGNALIYRVLTIVYTFVAEDGSTVQATVVGEAMDSGDKAANKAMAVAHKYALLQVFTIPTEATDDPDQETPDVLPRRDGGTFSLRQRGTEPGKISAAQQRLIFTQQKAKGIPIDQMRAHFSATFGVSHTADLERTDMDAVLAWIKDYEPPKDEIPM